MNLRNIYKQIFKKNYNISDYPGEIKLCLGCGNKPLPGFINVDYYNTKYADEIIDLNGKLPYASDSVDVIFSDNVFEHIEGLIHLIKECNRILKNGGFLIIKVPYFKSRYAYIDLTHKNFFTVQSLHYFVKDRFLYDNYKFFDECFECIDIFFDPFKNGLLKKLVSAYAISRPHQFENSILSSIFVLDNIIYVLKK